MMKEKIISNFIPASLLWMMLLGLTLSLSTLAEAGRGHYGHHHHHGHHHHGHHHHHHGGYAVIYNQPRGYYNQPYYPQPGYYPVPAPVYAPPPVYAYPPNVMFDISTDIGHFMFRY